MSTLKSRVFPRTSSKLFFPSTRSADSRQFKRNREIEFRAAEILKCHPHFTGGCETVWFRCDGKCLSLCGSLPSYYLKQLAQEAVRIVVDRNAVQIVNAIVVIGVAGETKPAVSKE